MLKGITIGSNHKMELDNQKFKLGSKVCPISLILSLFSSSHEMLNIPTELHMAHFELVFFFCALHGFAIMGDFTIMCNFICSVCFVRRFLFLFCISHIGFEEPITI
jgi:hypothetical protein